MKTLLVTVALLIGAFTTQAQTLTNIGCVQFGWDATSEAAQIHSYALYHATNYSTPTLPNFTGWEKIATSTNGYATNLSININVGPHFFFLVSSNQWGESNPSKIISTSNGPPTMLNFKVTSLSMVPCL